MAQGAQNIVGLLSCLVVQLVVSTHFHYGGHNGSAQLQLSNLFGTADNMGLPFNDTLRLLRSDNDTDSLNGTPILSYAAYPLVAVVHYKISTLRNLLTIPFRLLTLPVDVARAVWRTKEALQRPVDATMLGQLHDDLHKLNATSLPKKDSS